jgi:glycosyltransferase involved in cell wall biosynthesis
MKIIKSVESVKISVIIMAFNEANTLEGVTKEINSTLIGLGNPYEIVIINDGSLDETGTIADRLSGVINNVHVIHHEVNRGIGEVYRTGFSHAQGDLITFFPADGQFPAAIINQFTFLISDADMVLGYLQNRRASLISKGLSKMEKILYTTLFGPLPKFQGILMFRRDLLKELELKSTGRGWAVLMELIIRVSRGGYRVISAPTEIRLRLSGKSKVNNLATVWANLKQVFVLRNYI